MTTDLENSNLKLKRRLFSLLQHGRCCPSLRLRRGHGNVCVCVRARVRVSDERLYRRATDLVFVDSGRLHRQTSGLYAALCFK